jgi:NADH:ubiquinone oxidoreductase subunit E
MCSCDTCGTTEKATELREFIREAVKNEFPQSYLIAAMHKAQDLFGYMDPQAMRIISDEMRIPMSHIWGVATFYHYFNLEPRGKYIISICRGTACYVKGGEKVLSTLEQELGIKIGETTEDMLFSLLETRCLGACGLAPTMMINGRIYGELTPEKASAVISRLRKEAGK